jgi:hypothetical protein
MSVFDIDYDLLSWRDLPVRLRRIVLWGWLRAMIAPVVWLYGRFMGNRAANLYRLAHNSQVCYIEAVLNDVFDPISRGIYISDPAWHDPVYLYRDDELKPVWLATDAEVGTTVYDSPVWLFTDAETIGLLISFIVNVPVAVAGTTTYDMDRLRALVDRYKLPGKLYSVVTF